jgi:hypothetical protein
VTGVQHRAVLGVLREDGEGAVVVAAGDDEAVVVTSR